MRKVPPLKPRVATIVVGFSVRALAEATAAAIGPPLAVDHFADHDCCHAAQQVVRLNQWGGNVLNSSEFFSELFKAGAGPQSQVLLAGAMENWPELVELLHQHFTVLGPTVDQLRQLRSPECWQRWAQQSSAAFPETQFPQAQCQHNHPAGNWLIKPLRGAGGYSIKRASKHRKKGNYRSRSRQTLEDSSRSHQTLDGTSFFQSLATSATVQSTDLPATYRQRYVAGRSLGVYCVLHGDGSVELLGATESISAAQWPGPSEFIYRGSLGPIDLPSHHRHQIVALCQLIQRETGMLGWLQLDFVEDPAGELWLLELNPRWTAGMEVLFLAGFNPVQHHCRAWQPADVPLITVSGEIASVSIKSVSAAATSAASEPLGRCDIGFGKAIVYAPRDLELTHHHIESLHKLPRDNFSDLPSHHLIAAGQTAHLLSRGAPLLTVRARGPRDTLLGQLAELRKTALSFNPQETSSASVWLG